MAKMNLSVRTWLMLFLRLILFILIQSVFAVAYVAARDTDAWGMSANWWPVVVSITNVICLVVQYRLFRSEDLNFWNIFLFQKNSVRIDLLTMFGFLVLAAPLAYFPNVLLGKWLFGDANATLALFIRPLPMWVVYASIILFPSTQGLAETPLYFMYAAPRLRKIGYPHWLSILLPAIFLSLQHIAVPLLFDSRFIIWRALMYLPFAVLVGILLDWHPDYCPILL